MSGHEDKKTLKKWFVRKRHKRDLLVQQEADRNAAEEKRKAELARQQAPAESAGSQEEAWSSKTQEIRNKLTGKKREAGEKWNRFAGTSDAGGRGL